MAIACVSGAVSIYAAELTLALFSFFQSSVTFWGAAPVKHREEVVSLASKSGVTFDVRTKFEVIRDLRQQGIPAVPATVPLDLVREQPDGTFKSKIFIDGAEVLPVGGISNRVTVLCNETGKYIIYYSDQRGFHNPKTIWDSRTIAVAAVGDSFTIGACVPSDRNFVALVRKRYPATLNLGMLGEGPLTMLAAVKEYLPFLNPKVVLWFFYEENDFIELLQESKTPILSNYLQKDFSQTLFNRQGSIDQALSTYVEQTFNAEVAERREEDTSYVRKELLGSLKLSRLRQTLGLVDGHPQRGEYNKAQLNLFREVLMHAKKSVNGWGGTLYFVYLPARDRYANTQNYQRESILSTLRDIDVPVIDIVASFEKHGDPLRLFPFRRFGHYNEEGNQVVAEEVLRSLGAKTSQ